MNTGTGRMSISSWAMRRASLRSPPACASTERMESDTPRRAAAAAAVLLESLRARCAFSIPVPPSGILNPMPSFDGGEERRDFPVEGFRLFQVDRVPGARADPQARVRQRALEEHARLDTGCILVAHRDQRRHRHAPEFRLPVIDGIALALVPALRQRRALDRVLAKMRHELFPCAQVFMLQLDARRTVAGLLCD